MEPKALANLNGTLVTPMKNNAGATGAPAQSRECQTAPNHHAGGSRRRDSTLWMRSPEGTTGEDFDSEQQGDQQHHNWDDMLTPVPKTPAPETIAQFAMNMDFTPETPAPNGGSVMGYGDYGDYDELSASPGGPSGQDREQLLMRTCPPKQQQRVMFTPNANAAADDDVLAAGHGPNHTSQRDQSLYMRLMAARRKSLQFAPKIASPLSKAWQ